MPSDDDEEFLYWGEDDPGPCMCWECIYHRAYWDGYNDAMADMEDEYGLRNQ